MTAHNLSSYTYGLHKISSIHPSELWLIGPDQVNLTWHIFESEELRSGNRCYEFYWKEGDGSFLIGFRSKNNMSATYFHARGTPQIVYLDDRMNDTYRETTKLTILRKQWSMICINHNKRCFSLQQGELHEEYTFPNDFQCDSEYRIFAYPGSRKRSDSVIFNFGTNVFHYQMDNEFKRWTPLIHITHNKSIHLCFFNLFSDICLFQTN